jgi:hypothetical protein
LDFSVTEQLQGLLFCLYGKKVEWDALAPSEEESHCKDYELRAWETLGDRPGYFQFSEEDTPRMVAAAWSHKACVFFV